ncbi:hypothetical protein P0Y35_08205 [Kiritimatiellaeota bacterium B1221]|nr:hypothetical protein [Kiritimatiellaeota bacterium B1221]
MSDDPNQEWTPEPSSLRLKKRVEAEEYIAPPPTPEREKKKKKGKEKKAGQDAGRFGVKFLGQSIGSFLAGSLVLGTFLYHQINDLSILTPQQAEMARGIAFISFFVILVIEAFTEDLLQGVLCLFLPPYAFVYGLLFADAGPIRGLTMAMLVFLSAEMFLTPDNALVPKTTSALNEWIDNTQQKLINPGKKEAGFE